MDLSLDEGKILVELSRKTIEFYLKNGKSISKPKEYPAVFNEKRGVFVTLNSYPHKRLRGCIGYPLAYESLIDAAMSSALSAAVSDPRFNPVEYQELDNIVVEVTVLSPMKLLEKKMEYARQIKVGRDGLFVICGAHSGLLLPQVPVEWKWDEEQFLHEVCIKAGMHEDCYKNINCDMHAFTGQIFEETLPNGDIVLKKI